MTETSPLERALNGVLWPSADLPAAWQQWHHLGATEAWIAQLVSSLLVASGQDTVLETGGYMGTTSAWLALTLERMGGGDLRVADIDPDRAGEIERRLVTLPLPRTAWTVHNTDALAVISALPREWLGFAWIDDDHQQDHVAAEIEALWSKMKTGGLLVFHDVYGSTDLRAVVQHYNGYALDLPRIGPAGGLGVIQVR